MPAVTVGAVRTADDASIAGVWRRSILMERKRGG